MLDERTELLAKLMATEDIDIQQQNVPTAYFDTENRTLVLPTWKDLSEMETEMLIGHEIGHALYTPSDAWVSAIESFNGNKNVFKTVMNVIEDPRIERAVKKKYPGMRKVFYFGYEELFERGIFTKGFDPSQMTLIDKINFHFKIPGKIPFETDDQFWQLVNKVENCETFEDVVALTNEIYGLCEEEFNSDQQMMSSPEGQMQEESETRKSQQKDSGGSEDQQKKQKTGSNGKSSEGEGSEEESESATDSNKSEPVGEASPEPLKEKGKASSFESKYTNKVEEKMKKFLESKTEAQVKNTYYELPEPIIENILITNEELRTYLKTHVFDKYYGCNRVTEVQGEEEPMDLSSIAASYKKFSKDHAASIAYYTKMFDMKKKATEYKNTLQFKTGRLNMNALPNYKFDENVFLTTQVRQKGKNHGIVFYLDMSGSMNKYFRETLTQLMEVLSFCRNCGIPASVYGFTDNHHAIGYLHQRTIKKGAKEFVQFKEKPESTTEYEFALIELFSSNMTNKQFVDMFDLFLSPKWKRIDWFPLGGTPLVMAINTLEAVVNRFRRNTRAEIVNVVFLTDGGDTHSCDKYSMSNYYSYGSNITHSVLVDPKTKSRVSSSYLDEKYKGTVIQNNCSLLVPAAFLNLMKKRLKGVSFVNFFIDPYMSGNYRVEKKAVMEFDEMYIIGTDAFKKVKDIGKIQVTDMEDLKNTFSWVNNNKKQKRTMINSFIEKIVK